MNPENIVTLDGGIPIDVEKRLKRVVLTCKRWHVLETLAKAHRWERMVEVGVYKGFTMLHMLKHCPDLYVLGVDFYRQPEGFGHETYPEDMNGLYLAMASAIDRYPQRADLVRMDSVEASRLMIPDKSFDAVFIDADHRKHKVRADIEAWLPKLKAGGWMMGHDWHHIGVNEAVKELFKDPLILPDNVWAVRC